MLPAWNKQASEYASSLWTLFIFLWLSSYVDFLYYSVKEAIVSFHEHGRALVSIGWLRQAKTRPPKPIIVSDLKETRDVLIL
jgi:hypothetical protein